MVFSHDVRKIYEDESILVIDKPSGLVVTRSETTTKETLEGWLRTRYGNNLDRAGIIHRLDKDTSGLLLIAKTPEAFENLQKQFKERTVKKQYLALVHGFVESPGKVEGSIGRNPGNREKFMVVSPGRSQSPPSGWPNGLLEGERWAVTEYEPLKNFQFSIFNFQSIFNDLNKIQMRKLERMNYNQFTLLTCHPLTGRTHQIRVHLKYIGFPIVSDEKYVGRKMYRLDHRWCSRQFLHAARLEFRQPVSGKWMEMESELPEDLEEALGQLKVQS